MQFQYLSNVPLDKAKTEYFELLVKNGMTPREETIHVSESAGRVTAKPVYARINAPHNSTSAMDGIALEAALTFGATGTAPVTLARDQYRYVNTGDPLPDGCDAVIMLEDAVECGGGGIELKEAAAPWQHIRQIGEDICAGEMILPSYSRINPAALGAMIAGGTTELTVVKRPVAGFIPIGDELVPPTSDPKADEMLEFNSAIFSTMLHDWGAEAITYPIVGETPDKIHKALENALLECDIVIMGSGSSAGGEDPTAAVIADLGAVLYHGLAIKPGKTAILGYCGEKPVLGVPSYPISGIIIIEQLLRPIIEYLCHKPPELYRTVDAVLSKSVVSTRMYQEFIRVRMGYVNERLIATPLNRGSGIVTSFMKADGIIEIPQGVESYENGEAVNVRLLRSEEELRRSLVAIGSHDPLLDELSELLRVRYGDISMGSAHVGSIGGFIAVRRGEAHLAGAHLLDEETGEYNISFVRKYFPDGGVRLVECVKRIQGLILQKGNPKKILAVSDLAREGLSYVNRQKGSGTRILADYQCRKHNIDTSKIYGYNREEYTHTSVAALIAAGSADAGLGIYSAAKLYGLEFVPVCLEQYDLLIPDHAFALPMMQKLLDVLASDQFRKRLGELGGYILENPGCIRKVF